MQKFIPLQFFIKKFEDMSEEYFSASTDVNASDAWEWLEDDEQDALYEYIQPYGLLIHVNDGLYEYAHLGTTFKSRIVNFLKYVLRARSMAID